VNSIQNTNGISPPKFQQQNTAETLTELHRPIDPRHFKERKQGSITLTYVPWAVLAKHLHHRAPGWNWEIQSVQEVGGCVVVTGRLTIPTTDGLLHFSACASEPLESSHKPQPLNQPLHLHYGGLVVWPVWDWICGAELIARPRE
jgi:hypothetical protein